MNADERRSIDFGHGLYREMSTEVEPFRWGVAYLDAEYPTRYDSNLLWVEGAPNDVTVEGLVAECDRILGGRGLAHRRVMIDDPTLAVQLGAGLVDRGWSQEALVLMLLRGEPGPRPTPIPAEVVPFTRVRPLLEQITRREPWAADEDTVRALTDYRGKLERRAGVRHIAASIDGELAGSCELFVRGDEAQIESVATLAEYRGRGVASAVVLRAAEIARAEGARWIHLYADAQDWPQVWYRRLGFVDAGGFRSFTLARAASTVPA